MRFWSDVDVHRSTLWGLQSGCTSGAPRPPCPTCPTAVEVGGLWPEAGQLFVWLSMEVSGRGVWERGAGGVDTFPSVPAAVSCEEGKWTRPHYQPGRDG